MTVLASACDLKHTQPVAMLKAGHGMALCYANALVEWFSAQQGH